MTFIKSSVSSFALLDWFVAMHFIYSLLHRRSTEETNLSGLSAGPRWGAFWINTRQHKRRNNTRNNRQKTAHSSIEQYMSWLSWPPLRSLQKLLLNQHQTRQAQKQDNKQQTKYNWQKRTDSVLKNIRQHQDLSGLSAATAEETSKTSVESTSDNTGQTKDSWQKTIDSSD